MQLDFRVHQIDHEYGKLYALRSETMQRELATVFFYPETASEIAERVNAREAFFRNIPHVPIGSPFPRTPDTNLRTDYPDGNNWLGKGA